MSRPLDDTLATRLPVFQIEKYVADFGNRATYHLSASDAENLSVEDILLLDGGQSDAALKALPLAYSDVRGAPHLLASIALTYTRQTPETIMGFSGAGEAIFALFNVLFERGDHAITVTPNYQSHEAIPHVLGSVTCVPLDADRNWSLDLDRVTDAVQPNTKAIVINSPHNPTGTVLPVNQLNDLIEICRTHGLYLINDEVFAGLGPSTTEHPPAVADLYERGVSINVLSKAYGLPGLRVGWLATHDTALLKRIELFKHYLNVCTPPICEFLADIALRNREPILARNCGLVDENITLWRRFFDRHRDLFAPAFPEGGCIAFPKYLGPGSVDDLAIELREKHGIFVVPASVFSSANPSQHLRVGFGRKGLGEALQVLDNAMQTITG